MQATIARRMTESKTTVPHFYVTVEARVDEAVRVRQQALVRVHHLIAVRVRAPADLRAAQSAAITRTFAGRSWLTTRGIVRGMSLSVLWARDG